MDWLKRGFTTPLLDLIIYRNVRSLVGGKIRLMLSGMCKDLGLLQFQSMDFLLD